MEDNDIYFRQMEDDLKFQANGRQPQHYRQLEDDLKILGKWKPTSTQPKILKVGTKLEDGLNFQANGRQPQHFRQKEDDLNF